jgi:hypothetical protein
VELWFSTAPVLLWVETKAGAFMRGNKIVVATIAVSALLAASVSTADARWYHHDGPGPVLGLLGGIIVGAATIATLPLAIVADIVDPGPRRGYAEQAEYGPPPGAYDDRYGYAPLRDAPGYGPGYGYGPPPPPRYSRAYGPPPGYYGGYGPGY